MKDKAADQTFKNKLKTFFGSTKNEVAPVPNCIFESLRLDKVICCVWNEPVL